jgi:RNA polymerase sigma-70 factor (ECF subfamily)
MFAVCLRFTQSKEDAQDVLQDGFVKVFEHIGKFRSEGSLEGWIRKIIVNTAIEHYRKHSGTKLLVSLNETHLNDFRADDLIDAISAKELIELIRQLPTRYQMVFNLHVFEGYKHREIAEIMDISEGTSKSNFFDARALLRRALQDKMNTFHEPISGYGKH